MIYYKDLKDLVFGMHEKIGVKNIDGITIVSGYVGFEPIEELGNLPHEIHAKVVYGMYGQDKISRQVHEALVELQGELPNVEILYSTIPVHSKLYGWTDKETIKRALIGSANFSVSGLCNNYKETLCDISESAYLQLSHYFDIVLGRCIPCTSKLVRLRRGKARKNIAEDDDILIAENICRMSLLDRSGHVHAKSGLNWGVKGLLREAHTSQGDAYIAITKKMIRTFPEMFPPKKYIELENAENLGRANRQNDEVELVWDDGTRMRGLLEGTQDVDGVLYPKQISSSPSKNIIGHYLRKRIGVLNNGDDYRVTNADLEKYGRMSVDVSLLGEGIYYMDFSV